MRYSESISIPFYMVNEEGTLTLANLVNLVQQVSEHQLHGRSSQLDLVARYNIGWVITQSQIEIKRMPQAEEQVTLWTEATAYNRLLCYRDYGVIDADGNDIVTVHSTWVMMDLSTRKIVPVIDAIVEDFGAAKVTRVKRLPRLPKFADPEGERTYWVRYFDIDTNHHVNNVHYFDWMQDAIGYDWMRTHTLTAANIKYEREVEPGTQLQSQYKVVQEDGKLATYHQVRVGETVNATAHLEWQNK
ncbi:acyl-[acyl-carrier-protein] thioesterase [Lacticaseibacillus sharpeae]|uniref:acyl-[acyl-carrier-protein] thioesterase n=1 Tax=Lacticaseibacillus sharpeae TaxID=1626 RepID=UPI0009E92F3F|nr:acyl-ACP thioesterase domain-containing protein [Lacticaseibacillus sharpeae]